MQRGTPHGDLLRCERGVGCPSVIRRADYRRSTVQPDRFEQLDDHDKRVVQRLGYAIARAQLFEFAMAKLLEAQRHDLSVPLDDRWDEISRWLAMTAHTNIPATTAISANPMTFLND